MVEGSLAPEWFPRKAMHISFDDVGVYGLSRLLKSVLLILNH